MDSSRVSLPSSQAGSDPQSLTPLETITPELREEIARIIDPDAFEAEIRHIKNGYVPGPPTKIRVEAALCKAEAILAIAKAVKP